MRIFLLLIFPCVFLFQSCIRQDSQNTNLKSQIDILKNKVEQKKNLEIEFLKIRIPNVLVRNAEAGICTIFLYEPFGLKYQIKSQRPIFDERNFLCIPAAFTSKTDQIVGLFIENGLEENSVIDTTLNGVCILSTDNLKITDINNLDQESIDRTVKNKNSLFQQILLVNNSKIVDCHFFAQKENLRRAIIQFEDFTCVGESSRPITIQEFQQSLINIGAVNAIYLDMGTWSEGWYKNYNRIKIVIGEKMTDTNRQTNWLIYENE